MYVKNKFYYPKIKIIFFLSFFIKSHYLYIFMCFYYYYLKKNDDREIFNNLKQNFKYIKNYYTSKGKKI
jgi:hypothetical protein